MPSQIFFTVATADKRMSLVVEEDAAALMDALTSAHGQPFRLTVQSNGSEVYVNPTAIAYWLPSSPTGPQA